MDGRHIEVIQRTEGYLRLRLPSPLRTPALGADLEANLRIMTGVVRTSWLTVEGKLAVRFDPQRLTHADIAKRIKAMLPEAPAPETNTAPPPPAPAPEAPTTSLGERLGDLRAQLVAMTPERFRPIIESATTEKSVTNFFNELVAFYLIRTHWDLITRYWIKSPVKHGNVWLTVFYLVFLLVRYRKS